MRLWENHIFSSFSFIGWSDVHTYSHRLSHLFKSHFWILIKHDGLPNSILFIQFKFKLASLNWWSWSHNFLSVSESISIVFFVAIIHNRCFLSSQLLQDRLIVVNLHNQGRWCCPLSDHRRDLLALSLTHDNRPS